MKCMNVLPGQTKTSGNFKPVMNGNQVKLFLKKVRSYKKIQTQPFKCTLVRQKLNAPMFVGNANSFVMRFFECMTTYKQMLEACCGRDLLPNWQNTIQLFKMKVIDQFYRQSLNTGNYNNCFSKHYPFEGNLYLHLVSHHLEDLISQHDCGLTSIGTDQVCERLVVSFQVLS